MRHLLGIGGITLAIIAAYLLFAGISIETTVAAPSGSQLPDGLNGISNLQLMHVQTLNIILGSVSALGSCVLFAGAAIVCAIQDRQIDGHLPVV